MRGQTPYYQIEYRLRCKDGLYKWILARGKVMSRASDGAPLRMIGTHTDISERKEAEHALALSERRFRSLFQSMNEGVAIHQFVYDQEGKPVDCRIIDVNRHYEDVMELKAEAVVGRMATEVYGTKGPLLFDRFKEVEETGQGKEIDVLFERLDKYFHISIASYANGIFSTIFFDMTEQTRMKRRSGTARRTCACSPTTWKTSSCAWTAGRK
jgi:PAS domain-containing protein